jgi:hypothetical protein
MSRFWLARLMSREPTFPSRRSWLGKEFATVLASLAADPAVLEAAEWCAQITNEVTVDQTVPARTARATRCARRAFSVNTMAFRPYRESFASRMASASLSKVR